MGDILTLADGTTAPVSDTYGEQLDEPVIVYNFEVSDFHTYYVTDTGVLVHNDKCDREKILADNRKKGKLAQEKRHNELIESHPETKQEITIRPFDDNGELVDYNVRVDELTNSFFNEVKASESAPYTPNQLNGYLLLQRNGGMIRGAGKPGFEGGTKLDPLPGFTTRNGITIPLAEDMRLHGG